MAKDKPAEDGAEIMTSFAVFAAHLDAGMRNALRVHLRLRHSDLDSPMSVNALRAALKELTGV